jgi:Cell division protein FtsI/penicillin-binding protein 2
MIYETTNKKLRWVKIGALAIIVSITLKLAHVQIIDGNNLYYKAVELWQRSFPVEANRGLILDADNNVLATNLTTSSLVVVPSQIDDPVNTSMALAEILGVDSTLLQEKITKKVSIQRIQPEGSSWMMKLLYVLIA